MEDMDVIMMMTIIFFLLAMLAFIIVIIHTAYQQQYNCQEYETRHYRSEGTLLGTQSVKTVKERADYSEEVCVKW